MIKLSRGTFTVSKTFRIPEDMNDELGIIATQNNISMNNLVIQFLEYSIAEYKKTAPADDLQKSEGNRQHKK